VEAGGNHDSDEGAGAEVVEHLPEAEQVTDGNPQQMEDQEEAVVEGSYLSSSSLLGADDGDRHAMHPLQAGPLLVRENDGKVGM
jgi:hypothetical protein